MGLKLRKWWNYKVPYMLFVSYLTIVDDRLVRADEYFFTLSLFLLATVGMGGLGHFVNDYFDRDQDRLTKVENISIHTKASFFSKFPQLLPYFTRIKFLGILFLCVAPWFFIKPSTSIVCLLFVEVALFVLYSAPPWRFKERGFLGVLVDAAYAFTIPLLVTHLVFAGPTVSVLDPKHFIVLGLWSSFLGWRCILTHQMLDRSRDIRCAVRTFTVERGTTVATACKHIAFLAEQLCFLALLVEFACPVPSMILGFVGFVALRLGYRVIYVPFLTLRPGRQPKVSMLNFWIETVDTFYLRWLAPLVLFHGPFEPIVNFAFASLHLAAFFSSYRLEHRIKISLARWLLGMRGY